MPKLKYNNGTGFKQIVPTKKEFDSHLADYIHHAGYGVANGTNAKTITLDPVPSGYKEGMTVAFKNITQNTGAVTINVNGLGAKAVLKSNGNTLSSRNLKANSIYTIRYNGSNFILQGEGGEYGTAQAQDVLSSRTFGTEEGIKTGSMPNNGSISKTITTQGGSYTIPQGYHSGSGSVKAQFANLIASNIKKGVNVGGIMGNFSPSPRFKVVDVPDDGLTVYPRHYESDSVTKSITGISGTVIAVYVNNFTIMGTSIGGNAGLNSNTVRQDDRYGSWCTVRVSSDNTVTLTAYNREGDDGYDLCRAYNIQALCMIV